MTTTLLILGALALIGWYVWHTYGQVIDLMWPRDDEGEWGGPDAE